MRERLLAASAVAILLALAVAGSAAASSVSLSGQTASYTASPGEANDLKMDYVEDGGAEYISFSELIVSISATGPCFNVSSSDVWCPRVPNAQIDLGDGDDTVWGGPSNDAVLGGSGNDLLHGFAGNDILNGGDGDDQLEGPEPRGPTLESNGADVLTGGAGSDFAGYGALVGLTGRSGGVTVSLDGQANDGAPGEGDNVGSDIELVVGGKGPDTIVGDDGPNQLTGGAGNDVLYGRGGNDTLDGNVDNDQVYGEAGDDKVEGGLGDDAVDGGAGRDSLFGDWSSCNAFDFDCGTGNDLLQARDGAPDSVACGLGSDTATVDSVDAVAPFPQACENVDVGAVGGGAAPPVTGRKERRQTIAAVLRRGLKLRVTCTRRCGIRVQATIDRRTARRYRIGKRAAVVGRGAASLSKRGSKLVTVKLSPKAKRKLKRARKVVLRLRIERRYAGGTVKRSSTKVTLRR